MHSFIYITLVLSLTFCRAQKSSNEYSFRPYKEPRILFVVPVNSIKKTGGLFNNVFSKNSECTSKFGSGTNPGVCTDYISCLVGKGSFIGLCGLGTKACCRFEKSSGTLRATLGYFVSPTSPTSTTSTLSISKSSSSYCQVRLDFESFVLDNPDTEGVCSTGSMVVSGHLYNDITICGNNQNQHMYLTFDSSNSIQLTVTTQLTTASWRIKVTQISCSDTDKLAPAGCLQYFTEQTGTVQSFNYVSITSNPTPTTYQLANLDYDVCLNQSTDYCSVTWSKPTSASDYYFTVSSQVSRLGDTSGLGSDLLADAGASICTNDYVHIRGSKYTINDEAGTENTFCGLGFPSALTSTARPFRMIVHSDSQETTLAELDDGNVGFSLQYTLNSC